MKQSILIVGLVVVLGLGLTYLVHAEDMPMPMPAQHTVTGEVLDLACYMSSGAHGQGHAACARMCLSNGMPAGLLTAKGKVYLLVPDHNNDKPYAQVRKMAAEQVKITGHLESRGGLNGIVVENVEKAKAEH